MSAPSPDVRPTASQGLWFDAASPPVFEAFQNPRLLAALRGALPSLPRAAGLIWTFPAAALALCLFTAIGLFGVSGLAPITPLIVAILPIALIAGMASGVYWIAAQTLRDVDGVLAVGLQYVPSVFLAVQREHVGTSTWLSHVFDGTLRASVWPMVEREIRRQLPVGGGLVAHRVERVFDRGVERAAGPVRSEYRRSRRVRTVLHSDAAGTHPPPFATDPDVGGGDGGRPADDEKVETMPDATSPDGSESVNDPESANGSESAKAPESADTPDLSATTFPPANASAPSTSAPVIYGVMRTCLPEIQAETRRDAIWTRLRYQVVAVIAMAAAPGASTVLWLILG